LNADRVIDLRSDTVTRPTRNMRDAMARAEVGDDVFGEDPTVNALQEKLAGLFGMEAAIFVPSGVMANQLAIKVHTQPGNEIIVEWESHIFNYETAGPSLLSGVQMFPLKGERGIISAEQVAQAIRPAAYYMPRTTLICLENTHNMAGGMIYPIDQIGEISVLAKARGIRLHLDGARLWNACVATGNSPRAYARYVDSVAVCFSKGLGAPIGSALVGSREAIERARTYRKIFGGGMRQVGVIASAAAYAMEHHVDRLKDDHENARALAAGIAGLDWLALDVESVQTNILIIDVSRSGQTAETVIEKMRADHVLLSPAGSHRIRAVTHLDVTREDIENAIRSFKNLSF